VRCAAGGRQGYLGVARIAVAALAMVLADMQVQERPATEAETAKRTGRIRGPGHVVLLTIQVKPTVVKPGCGCCGGLMERARGDPADGRFTNAILLPAGLSTLESAAPSHVAYVRQLVIDNLSPSGHVGSAKTPAASSGASTRRHAEPPRRPSVIGPVPRVLGAEDHQYRDAERS
jgi:hypothetical protein